MKPKTYRIILFQFIWVFLGMATFALQEIFFDVLASGEGGFFKLLVCVTVIWATVCTAWLLTKRISILDREEFGSGYYAEADELASLPTDDNYIVLFDTVDEEGVQILLLKATSDKCLYYVYCNDKCRVPSGTKFLRFIKSLRHIDGIDYGAVFADGDNWESHRVCELEY